VVGLKPISSKMVQARVKLMKQQGVITKRESENDGSSRGVKTAIAEFMKQKLKTEEYYIENIQFKHVFFYTNPDSEVVYIEMGNEDEAAFIYRFPGNLL
jgi:hypothetical protein